MSTWLYIPHLKASAARRPTGFVEYVLARGKIQGPFVGLDDNAIDELREKFPDPRTRSRSTQTHRRNFQQSSRYRSSKRTLDADLKVMLNLSLRTEKSKGTLLF